MAFDPALIPPDLFKGGMRSGFEPKLDKERRCAVLALHKMGFSKLAIARVYGVHKSTVGHVCNPASPHYKSTRREASSMEVETFKQMYLNEDIIGRAIDEQQKLTRAQKEAIMTGIVMKPEVIPRDHYFNPRASLRKGTRTININGLDTIITIEWINESRAVGWYWSDADFPDLWHGPFFTSQNAERAAKLDDQAARDGASISLSAPD